MSDSLELLFSSKYEEIRTLKKKPTNEEFLQLYSLGKQSKVGDCNITLGWFASPKDTYKFNYWKKLKGLSKEDAMKKYIALVDTILTKYN